MLETAKIIEDCGGRLEVSHALQVSDVIVYRWLGHGIPLKYWETLISLAPRKVTPERLYKAYLDSKNA